MSTVAVVKRNGDAKSVDGVPMCAENPADVAVVAAVDDRPSMMT